MRNNYRDVADIPDITKVVPVSQGGFGGKNNIESAEVLDVLRKSDIGQLIAPAPTSEKPLEVQGPDFTQPLLKGPSFIVQGLPFRYTILNPKPVGENTVSISEGSIKLEGFDIVGTATSSLGSCTMTVNGREIHVPVREARPMAPVLTCVHDGKTTGSSLIPFSIDDIKTSGYEDVLKSTEYQYSDDKNFSRILNKIFVDEDRKSYTFEMNERGKTIFFRARIKGAIGAWSDWSNVVMVTIETDRYIGTSILKIPRLSSTDKLVGTYSGNVLLINDSVQTKRVEFLDPTDLSKIRVFQKERLPGLPNGDIRNPPDIPSDSNYVISLAYRNASPTEMYISTVKINGITDESDFLSQKGPILFASGFRNESTKTDQSSDGKTAIVNFYAYAGTARNQCYVFSIDQSDGSFELQQTIQATDEDNIYSSMSTALSPDGLTLLFFDVVSGSGTRVRMYTRTSLSQQFGYNASGIVTSKFCYYNAANFSDDGRYLVLVGASNSNYEQQGTAELYELRYSANRVPDFRLVDSMSVPVSGPFDAKTIIRSRSNMVYLTDSVYQATVWNYTRAYRFNSGRFEEQSWMRESLEKNGKTAPLIFNKGKSMVLVDNENYTVLI